MSEATSRKRVIERPKSIIPALDVMTLKELGDVVNCTCDVDGVEAYKLDGVGSCVLGDGVKAGVAAVRDWTDKAIIFDFQKAGNDIPKMGTNFAASLEGLVQAAILFPFTGPVTQEEWTKALQDKGITPIIGAEMTHPGFNHDEGGYVAADAPRRIFEKAVELGVRNFVVPGNKPKVVEACRILLEGLLGDEQFDLFAPGFVGQGGVISEAGQVAGDRFHAIVGSGIYEASNMREAAETYCSQILAS